MILGFSSVCEGLFTHTEMATVAGSVPRCLAVQEALQQHPERVEPFQRAGRGAVRHAARRSSWKIGINHTSRTGPVRCILQLHPRSSSADLLSSRRGNDHCRSAHDTESWQTCMSRRLARTRPVRVRPKPSAGSRWCTGLAIAAYVERNTGRCPRPRHGIFMAGRRLHAA